VSLERGRPNYLGEEDLEAIQKFLTPDPFFKSASQFREFVQQLVNDHLDKLKKPREVISDRFLSRLEEELGIKTGGAEETTDARAAAACAHKRKHIHLCHLNISCCFRCSQGTYIKC
jgi:hypothetical protein